MKYICKKIIILIILGLVISGSVYAKDLSGDFSIGYTLTDDENNQSLLYERYNYYDGASVSLNNFMYTKNNIVYMADINNIAMNNRNILFSIYNPKRFRVSARHNKFRRIYDTNEQYSTKRDFTDINGEFTINKNLKFFASFTNQQNKGNRLFISETMLDSLASSVDYTNQVATGGFNYSSSMGNINARYSYSNYDDEVDSLYVQKSDMIHVNGSFKVPGYDKYRVYGGFTYLQNKLNDFDYDLKNYHGWVGSKAYFSNQYLIEYRFLYNRNSHEFRQLETDTWHHLVSISKQWNAKYGLRVGYDYVIADDLLNRTTRNGFLLNGWARFSDALSVKAETNYFDKQTEYGTTLYGNTVFNRNRFSVRYRAFKDLILSGNYLSRIKENENIDTKIDYGKYTGNVVYTIEDVVKFSGTVSYAEGDYKNQSQTTSYLFSNTYLRGSVAPYISKKLSLAIHGSLYNLKKDQDYRKINMSGDLNYELYENWQINLTVNSFNVEDYLLDDNYDGYIFSFNLVKHFEK